ncbi:hypothetical protein H2203_006423 [Taxawa tesnikishii (nom. ined.)]|nr:hypothetical protein H2203_006423 [Dothideales sp. JES 119]
MDNEEVSFSALPIIDLSWASSTSKKPLLLKQLHDALFNVGFLYIKNHGVPSSYISDLASLLPSLFDLPDKQKNALSKLNSPHFLGYSGYHDAVQALSYRFVHLIEEAFDIPTGTFDDFFRTSGSARGGSDQHASASWMPPQHRIKLVKYPPNTSVNNASDRGQGVGAHKDSSGWLTFLYQVGEEEGLEVLNTTGDWIAAPPLEILS